MVRFYQKLKLVYKKYLTVIAIKKDNLVERIEMYQNYFSFKVNLDIDNTAWSHGSVV